MRLNKRKVLEAARKHSQKGAKAKALKEYQKLLKADPNDAKLRLEIGDAYRRWGDVQEAVETYARVADQYMKEGFDARAVAVYKQIQNLDPEAYGSFAPLADLYQRMGLTAEAIGALQTAAEGYQKAGKKREALEMLRKMATLDPSNTTSRLKVADLLRQEEMNDEALVEYDEVVAELERQGDREEVSRVCERILEIEPDRVPTLLSLTDNLLDRGQAERAEPFAKRAVELEGDVPEALDRLARVYQGTHRDEELKDVYRRLADVYRQRGDEERAREITQRFAPPDLLDANALDTDPKLFDEIALENAVPGSEGLGADGPSTDLLEEEVLPDDSVFDSDPDEIDLGAEAEPYEPPAQPLETPAESASVGDAPGDADAAIGEPDALSGDDGELPQDEPDAASGDDGELPQGEPEQLMAEASVYLRYGKREPAIANLRGVLAQEPQHRGALEKIGEAYADGGENERAVAHWLKAADLARADGDANALRVLRGRIGALDEAAAASLDIESPAPPAPAPPAPEPAAPAAPPEPLEGQAEQTLMNMSSEPQIDIDDIEIDVDTTSFDEAIEAASEAVDQEEAEAADIPSIDADEVQAPEESLDLDLGDAPDLDVSDIDIDIDVGDDTGDDELDTGDDLDVGDDLETDEGVAGADAEDLAPSSPGASSSTTQQIVEDLEEADFYMQQGLLHEAEAIFQRILSIAPNHPHALVRLGEIAAERGDDPGSTGSGVVEPAPAPAEAEEAPAANELDAAADELAAAADDAVDIDALPPEDEEGAVAESAEDTDTDVEIDVDEELGADEVSEPAPEEQPAPVEVSEPEEPVQVEEADDDTPVDDPTVEEPIPEPPPAPAPPAEAPPPALDAAPAAEAGDPGFDLAAEISDVFDDDDTAGQSGSASEDDGFAAVFSAFKKGVSQTLTEGDHDTHYDLGIAYREMGLLDDAASEFRAAMGGEGKRLEALHMLGLCSLELGRSEEAVEHLGAVIESEGASDEQKLAARFELGRAWEASGDVERARAAYQAVADVDPSFCEVEERIAGLGSAKPDEAPADDDAGFESFDDVIAEAGDDAAPEAAAEPESFESFDDVMSEVDDEEDEPEEAAADAAEPEAAEAAEAADEPEAEEPEPAEEPKKPAKKRKKKISFV